MEVLHWLSFLPQQSVSRTTFEVLEDRHRDWFFIVAHPGHELRAYHVLERVRPAVAVLTDGSGSMASSRIGDTRALLEGAGGTAAGVFGAFTDRQAYEALMTGDADAFLRVVDDLVREVRASDATAIVIDAAEGYNPVHDVCHWIGRTVIDRLAAMGRNIDAFELDLVGHPDGDGAGVRVSLDEAAFARKLDAVERYEALAGEAAAAFAHYGADAFRVEFLRHLPEGVIPPGTWVPHYETVGEARVLSGQYSAVLRYGLHVRPILEAFDPNGALSNATAARSAYQ